MRGWKKIFKIKVGKVNYSMSDTITIRELVRSKYLSRNLRFSKILDGEILLP